MNSFVGFYSSYSKVIIFAIFMALAVVLILHLKQRLSSKVRLPGGPNGLGKILFNKYREDAFLWQVLKYRSRNLLIDNVPATAEPSTMRALLLNREHSIGRSWVYRLVPMVMPYSDGMLFAANDEWRKRHSLFTPLFQTANISKYTNFMLEGVIRVCELQLGKVLTSEESVRIHHERYSNSDALISSCMSKEQPPIGSDIGTRADLLTLVRWSATKTLASWAYGVRAESDMCSCGGNMNISRESDCECYRARRLLRTVDSYARICFENMPLAERGTGVGGWISEYLRLRKCGSHLRNQVSTLVDTVRPTLPSSSEEKTEDSARSPDNFFQRMVRAGWSDDEITGDTNHLNGAHKAVAFVSTMALTELSFRPDVRDRVIAELRAVCGDLPPELRTAEGYLAFADKLAASSTATSSARAPSRADIDEGRLPYTMAVMKETLRRHVVSLGTLRKVGQEGLPVHEGTSSTSASSLKSVSEDPLDNYDSRIPAGEDIVLLLHALHHDPELWGVDAHVWEPDRWVPDSQYWADRIRLEKQFLAESSTLHNYSTDSSSEQNGIHNRDQCILDALRLLKKTHGIQPVESLLDAKKNASIRHFPAYFPDSYFPFLDGTRRCAGMLLAQLEFCVLLYGFLVLYDVQVRGPAIDDELVRTSLKNMKENNITAYSRKFDPFKNVHPSDSSSGYGGGELIGAGQVIERGMTGTAVALMADPLTKNGHRYHIVKLPDMFTAVDGVLPYDIKRRL